MKFLKGLLVIALISIITVSCNETKKGVEKDLKEAVEATEEVASDAVEATEEVVSDAVEAIEEAVVDVLSWSDIPVVYPKDIKLQNQVNDSRLMMAKENPNVGKMYNNAYGYVVFPKITKGGLIVGGAGGHGLVFEKNTVIGASTLMQATIGAQIGGQQYAEYIFFEDKAALDRFTNNKFKFASEISAVALDKAVSGNVDYQDGVAVYTHSNKGLMAEAALGTQKFKYKGGIN
ncbi:MAG: hypothetical protein GQ552_01215 [Flavobacteriaceae bacterium]|nr:hypothetical protein [Flavobacteriaceae bacterium]